MEMANINKQTEQNSTEEVNFEMRTSFSWDRAFFTNDGFLADEELASIIEGGDDDFQHELQTNEKLECLESKLFQDIEASTQKSTKTVKNLSIKSASRKRDFQAKKVTRAVSPRIASPIKTPPTSASPLSCGSPENNVKPQARRSMTAKTGKANADSPSKTPPRITVKNKVASGNAGKSRTSPASPVSPRSSSGSPSSTFAASQRSKRSGNEKPSARRNDEPKPSKPAVGLMPKTQSSISSKIRPPPVVSCSTTQQPCESSSSPTSTVDQRSKTRGNKGSPVHHTSKSTSRNSPSAQTPVPYVKQPATACKTASPKKQIRSKGKMQQNLVTISPEILDLKGKINALKMEISIQKERCNKMAGAGSFRGELKTPLAIEECGL